MPLNLKEPLLPGYRLFQVREFLVLIEETNNLKVIIEYTLVLLQCIDLSHKMLHIQILAKNKVLLNTLALFHIY